MKNNEIADIFNRMADLLEIKGENPFRIRAYRRAAFTLETLNRDIGRLSREELLDLPGIGSDLASKIGEYLQTGSMAAYEKLKSELPEGLATLLTVPGVGPKTAGLLYREFRVTDIAGLEQLAREHRLSRLPGIKAKTEAAILKGIELLRRYEDRRPLGTVLQTATELADYLRNASPAARIEIAGSLRRRKETVRDIDLIAASKDPAAVMKAFLRMPLAHERLEHGTTRSSVVLGGGIQVDLRVVDPACFGAALLYFTGSKAHNIRLRELALKKGLRLNEYGVFRVSNGRFVAGSTEQEVYEALGLPLIPPELREDSGEIEAGLRHEIPCLVELADVRGDLHMHSSWSDGSLEIEELLRRPIELGYEYALLTDHTRGPGVPRGLTAEQVIEQKKRIDALNRRLTGFRLLAGVETNIRNDGSLDLDDGVLKKLDLVVASVHSGFSQTQQQLTRRITTAMRNHRVSIIGHPTGRLLGERDPYAVDIEEVISVAAETGTALEINAYPLRLDLNDHAARRAKDKGVLMAISTDAHRAGQFDAMAFGVSVARRGWLEKKDIINTYPLKKILQKMQR